jgi:multiple sugar transport system permease protein
MTPRRMLWQGLGYSALALMSLLSVAPLCWMLAVALMQPGESSNIPPPIWSMAPSLVNFVTLSSQDELWRHLANSTVISLGAVGWSLLFNTTAGYAFAKLRFYGREALHQLFLAALVIPAQVAMLPLFLILKYMHLINTMMGVWIPSMVGIFSIFLVRQAVLGIPDALLDSARVDGASEWRIFWEIVVPLLRPVLVTLGVFTFLGVWNDFLWPLIVLNDGDKATLPVALAALVREHVQDNELMMAGAVVTIVPTLVLFISLQRFYIAGLMSGGVKG